MLDPHMKHKSYKMFRTNIVTALPSLVPNGLMVKLTADNRWCHRRTTHNFCVLRIPINKKHELFRGPSNEQREDKNVQDYR